MKPLASFSRDRSTKDGHCYHCKACLSARAVAWAKAHPDKRAEHRKRWRDNNLELAREIEKRSYEDNREQRLQSKREYAAANRPRYVHYTQKRKIAQGRATPNWADHAAIIQIYEQCAAATKETGVMHHVDHIVPLQGRDVCGFHVQNNLQILPADVNRRKANKHT